MKRFAPPAILAAAWALFVLYAYPGTLTFDSIDILIQARAGVFRDDQPPVYTMLWRLVDHVAPAQFGMLVIQSLALLIGLYLVFRKTYRARGAAIAAGVLFLFPPVMTMMTAIWKDSLMSGLMVLGIGCLLHRARVAGIALLTLAAAVRFNAPPATLPPIVLLLELGFRGWRRYAIAFGVWVSSAAVAMAANTALVDRETHAWSETLAVYDIMGMLAHIDETIPDAKLKELLDGSSLLVDHDIHATARQVFDQKNYLTAVTDPTHPFWHFSLQNDVPVPIAFQNAMARTWTYLAKTYPGAYARHRLATFDLVLDGEGPVPWRGDALNDLRASMGLQNGASEYQRRIRWRLVKLTRWFPSLFSPWMYFLASLALIPLAWRDRLGLSLLVSAVLYETTYLPLGASRDYRYSHWLVTACCIAIVTLTARRSRVKVRA